MDKDMKIIKPETVGYTIDKFACIIGILPTSYKLAYTYEEQINCIGEYLENTVYPAINNNAEALQELQGLFLELKDYVDNYFDNLDVQTEINNKLDEMLENGELEEILGDYIFQNLTYNNVSFIFPQSQGFVNSGDCILIKAYDKNIVIDSHRASAKTGIEDFLDRNNVEHIDYFILTHYHDDHAGNLVSLITDGYIDTNSHVYLPAYSHLIDESTSILNYYNAVHNKLVSENIPNSVPDEEDTLEIQDFKLTFYNCETAIFNQYNYTDYNDCSTVCLVEYGNKKALFTGDISNKPFIRFNELDMFNYHIDFYKIQHHGINYQYESAIHFLRKILPNYAVQTAELNDFLNNTICQGSDTSFLKYQKCEIFSVYENESDIIFNVSKYEISLKNGKSNVSQSNRPAEVKMYVDASAQNSKLLGTQTDPFTDLPQCFAKLTNNPNVRYTIYLSDGDYSLGNTTAYASKMSGYIEIILQGNTTDSTKVKINNGLQLFNGVQMTLKYITVKGEGTLLSRNSFLILDHCTLDGEETDTKTKTLLWSTNSNIVIDHCNIQNASLGVSGHYDRLYINNTTFLNLTTAIQNQYGSMQLSDNTYTDCNTNRSLLNNSRNFSESSVHRELIGSANTQSGDVQLTKSIKGFKLLLFTFGAVSTGQLTSAICMPYRTENFQQGSTYQVPFNYTVGGNATAGVLKFQVDSSDPTLIHITQCDGIPLRTIYGVNLVDMRE